MTLLRLLKVNEISTDVLHCARARGLRHNVSVRSSSSSSSIGNGIQSRHESCARVCVCIYTIHSMSLVELRPEDSTAWSASKRLQRLAARRSFIDGGNGRMTTRSPTLISCPVHGQQCPIDGQRPALAGRMMPGPVLSAMTVFIIDVYRLTRQTDRPPEVECPLRAVPVSIK